MAIDRKSCKYEKECVSLPLLLKGTVAQLNRASDYGSEGCGFESHRCHEIFIVLVFGCRSFVLNGRFFLLVFNHPFR